MPECARVPEQSASAADHQTQPNGQKDACLRSPKSGESFHTLGLRETLLEENRQVIFIEQAPIRRILRAGDQHSIVIRILAQQQEPNIVACESLRPMPIDENDGVIFEQ